MKNTNCGQPERGSRNPLFAIGRLSTPARGDVTDIACPGGILLVEQQVSLSLLIRDRNGHTSDFHVAPSRFTEASRTDCELRIGLWT